MMIGMIKIVGAIFLGLLGLGFLLDVGLIVYYIAETVIEARKGIEQENLGFTMLACCLVLIVLVCVVLLDARCIAALVS